MEYGIVLKFDKILFTKMFFLMQNLRQGLDQLLANLQILYNIHFSNRILWFTVSKCLLKVNKTPQTSKSLPRHFLSNQLNS